MTIMQKRNVNLREVLSYPLGPLPWSLSRVAGELKKTNKAALLHKIENDAPALDVIPRNCVGIFDGMGEVQSYKAAGLTFGEFSDGLLRSILNKAATFIRIDIVFDVYKDISIKAAGRRKRQRATTLKFSTIISTHKIKQWHEFLSNATNKMVLNFFG